MRPCPTLQRTLVVLALAVTTALTLGFAREAAAEQPKPKLGPAMVYDPVGQRVLMFGKTPDPYGGETMALWSLTTVPNQVQTWTRVTVTTAPDGMPPEPTYHYNMVYDSRRHRVVFLHGMTTSLAFPEFIETQMDGARTCVLQLSTSDPSSATWLPFSERTAGPSGRILSSAVYDSVGDRIIVFGGISANEWASTIHDDCWQLKLETDVTGEHYVWTQIVAGGNAPGARCGHQAFFERERNRMIVFGGYPDLENGNSIIKIWALSLNGSPTWARYNTYSIPPTKRMLAAGGYDAPDRRYVAFGGMQWGGAIGDECSITPRNDGVWDLRVSPTDPTIFSWARTQVSPLGVYGYYGVGAAWASSRDAVIAFGGERYQYCNFGCLSDLTSATNATLSLASPGQGMYHEWSTVQANTAPLPVCDPWPPGDPGPGGFIEGALGVRVLDAMQTGGPVRFSVNLPEDGELRAQVMDLQGRLIADLGSGRRERGVHVLHWDLRDRAGERVRPGVYLARVRTNEHTASRTFVIR